MHYLILKKGGFFSDNTYKVLYAISISLFKLTHENIQQRTDLTKLACTDLQLLYNSLTWN